MGKIKSFLTDSHLGYVLSILKFGLSQLERSYTNGSLKKHIYIQFEEDQEEITGHHFLLKWMYFH